MVSPKEKIQGLDSESSSIESSTACWNRTNIREWKQDSEWREGEEKGRGKLQLEGQHIYKKIRRLGRVLKRKKGCGVREIIADIVQCGRDEMGWQSRKKGGGTEERIR